MKSLHEEVRQRRVAEPAELTCVSLQAGSAALVVRQWQGASWVLPWAQFIGARFAEPDGKAVLELSFASYTVTVTGDNLETLLDDLAAQRIGCLRDLPAKFQLTMDEGTPFITRLEVRALSPVAEAREPS